jgi:uncharacterized protein (DUF488 family)
MPLYTVGHGTLAQDALASLLVDAGIGRVVDVRRFPGSRRHPHVNREALAAWLPEVGIGYRWEEALGGRRGRVPDSPHVAIRDPSFRAYADHMASPEFAAALARLVEEARDHVVAVMCAEAVWWRCHRQFVADAATALHGVEVRHLLHDGRRDVHRLTEGGRVVDDRLVYDAAQPPLFDG